MGDWENSPAKRPYPRHEDDRDRERERERERDERDERDGSRHKRRRPSEADYRLPPPPPPPPPFAPDEIEFRILCPVSSIGAVIGKGGSIVKSLREATGAKIRVEDVVHHSDERVIYVSSATGKDRSRERGRGGSRDGGDRDRDRDSDDSRERSRERERSGEACDAVCPAQEALLKIHERITAKDGGARESRDSGDDEGEKGREPDVARLLVSDAQVGCLIGKGGRIIEQMRKDIAVQIRVLPKSSLPPCAFPNDELVQLSGTPALVKKALYVVSSKLYENPIQERANRAATFPHPSIPAGGMYPPFHAPSSIVGIGHYGGRGGGGNAFPARAGRAEAHAEEELMVCILCPNEKIGSMIGKGGSIIRKLREDSSAKIRVCDQVGDADERVIQISAIEYIDGYASPVLEAVIQVCRRLADIAADKEGRNAILSIRILVRSSQIGCLLGKGGQIITEMRRTSRANIRIPPKEELPKCADGGSELVQISGEAPMVEAALIQVLTRLRSNLFRGRDGNRGSFAGHDPAMPAYGGRDDPVSPGGYPNDYGDYSTSPAARNKDSRRRAH